MVAKGRPVEQSELRNLRREMSARFNASSSRTRQMKILLEKDDSEEQKELAKALLANKLIRAIEREACQSHKVTKTDDEVTKAVIEVVKYFGVCTQWTAVYRVLVDFCGWDSDVVKFNNRMTKLLENVPLEYKCNYQAIQKPLSRNSILRKNFQQWRTYRPPIGDKVFPRQIFIAKKMLELLSISV